MRRSLRRAPGDALRAWKAFAIGTLVFVLAALGVVVASHQPGRSANSGAVVPGPGIAPRARPKIIAGFVGDSWTGGSDMGGNGSRNWSAIVARHYGWRDVPFAVGGTGWLNGGATNNTFASPERVHDVARTRPDVLFITDGVNDLNIEGSKDTIQQRLDQLPAAVDAGLSLYRAELPKSQIVLVGIIPANGTSVGQVETEKRLAAVARRHDVHLIDQSERGWFAGTNHRYIGKDHFHPTDAGHRYLARRMIERLDMLGAATWPQVYKDWSQAARA